MRRAVTCLALLVTFACGGGGVGDARQATQRIAGTVPATEMVVQIDENNATAGIKYTGRAFVDPANDLFDGIATTRYNRSRIVRLINWTSSKLDVFAQGIPGGNGDLAVMVDGSYSATISVDNATAIPRWYTLTGLGTASKTIEIWEDFQQRDTNLNSGSDGVALGTYVKAVQLPAGASVQHATASTVIVAFGDSHMDGNADRPWSSFGWAGQLRKAAEAHGWLLAYVGAGSSTLVGDGATAAQIAQTIHDVWTACGATDKRFLMMRRPNDYAYYGTGLSTTPTQYGTYVQDLQTALDASDPGWTGIYTRIPQGASWGANTGGYTRDDYWDATVTASTAGGRTNVTTHDYTVFTDAGLNLATAAQWFEANPGQVHLAQPGHDIVFGVARTWYGL